MFYPSKLTFLLVIFLLFGISQKAKAQGDLSLKLEKANSLIYSDPEKSVALATEVYKNSPENSSLQLSSLIVLGTAYGEKINTEKSIESLLKAQKIAEVRKDYVNQARVLSLIGYQYQSLQMNEKTHSYLDQAEDIINRHALPDSLLYLRGNNYSIKASMYEETLGCDYAIEYFNKAINIYKKLKNNDIAKTNLCIGYLHKSLCFLEKSNIDSARVSLMESDRIIKQMKLADDVEISQQIAWARYHTLNKHHKRSITILNNILERAIKMPQVGLDMEIYRLLSQNYLAIDDIPQYNHFSYLYTETKKKFSEIEKKSITHIINKPAKNNNAGLLKLSENKFYILLITLCLIFSIILFFIIKSYRLKKKIKDFRSNQES